MESYNPKENTQNTPQLEPVEELKKGQRPPKIIYMFFVLAAIAGILIAKFALDKLAQKTKGKAPAVAKTAGPGKVKERLPETAPLPQLPSAPVASLKKNPLPALTLSGIFYDDKLPCALIDNKIVKEGDLISGAKVLQISANAVKMEFEGETFDLTTR